MANPLLKNDLVEFEMANPFLKNYLVEYVDGRGLTNLAAEVEAPDADRARTQMLSELEKRGLVSHKNRSRLRKAKGLGEARLKVSLSDKGTTGARIYIPWIQQGDRETTVIIPEPKIPQPKLPLQRVEEDLLDGEAETLPTVNRSFVSAKAPSVEEEIPEEGSEDVELPIGTPLIGKVFGRSPVMDISRRSGGK